MPARWPFGAGSMSTVRTRIQWLVVACIVPVALLLALLLVLSYQRGREALLQANLQAARVLTQAVERELDASVQVLQALAASRSIDDRDFQRFHAQARDALKHVAADNIVLFDSELRGLASAAHEWGSPLPQVRHDRFPQVLKTAQPAVSDLFMGQVSKQQQVAVAVPVLRDGRAIARLEMVFGLRRFADVLAQQNLAPHWTGAVLDAQGIIVARTRDAQQFVGKPSAPKFYELVRSVREGAFDSVTADGIAVAATFSRGAKHGWTGAIGVPNHDLTAQLQRSLWLAGMAAVLLLGAGLLLARTIGHRITAPIQALVQPALAIGRGENAAVAASTLHEAHELGRALQQAQALLLEREQARQHAEAGERAVQSRLQMALDTAEIGDWDINTRTGEIRHSLQHDRCYGYTEPATDWNAEKFFSCIHPDDGRAGAPPPPPPPPPPTPWQDDFRVVWPDGSVHWLTSRGAFVSRPGEAGFIVGVVIDVTTRKQAEELRLHSVRLEAENRQIQEANQLKSEFLANMSHELRTPLNAVIGFAEILRGDTGRLAPDKRAEYLNHIGNSGRHLLRLINDVLDLSKVESGKFELVPEPIELPQVVRDVVAVLQPEASRRGVRVESEVDPALTDLTLDPARLKQMLYNLLSNAIKFTDAGGRVWLRARPEGEQHLRVEVEDTGIGIAAGDLTKLFRQFQQVHTGLSKAYPGTGLGLVLTRHLAELHGGSVGVRSTPGEGSVFHLVLPRQVSPARPPEGANSLSERQGRGPKGAPSTVAVREQRPLQQPSATGDAPTVLVIEDDGADQAHLAKILRTAGYRVELAGTGARALQLAAAQRYDAITLDLLLPDRSGLEVLNALRSGGPNREVPVVVITVVTETSALAGFAVSDVLTKPVRAHEVKAALRRVSGAAGSPPKVLVVDDDAGTLELMAATLHTLGIEAQVASSAAQALEMIEQQPPDAVILDLVMPGMNGFDLLHELRARPRWQLLPVFVWTSLQLKPEERAALRASAQAVVAKAGGGLDTLVEQLRGWQARREQGASP
jgi:signal transduction histidine kinase/DNA-binding response OmpR family regulator